MSALHKHAHDPKICQLVGDVPVEMGAGGGDGLGRGGGEGKALGGLC